MFDTSVSHSSEYTLRGGKFAGQSNKTAHNAHDATEYGHLKKPSIVVKECTVDGRANQDRETSNREAHSHVCPDISEIVHAETNGGCGARDKSATPEAKEHSIDHHTCSTFCGGPAKDDDPSYDSPIPKTFSRPNLSAKRPGIMRPNVDAPLRMASK